MAEPKFHPLLDQANWLLNRWSAPDAGQARLRSEFIRHAMGHHDSVFRTCASGHLTASALVVDASRRRVLLVRHPRVGRWIQMGGHIEPTDASIPAAAAREAAEESGIDGLVLDPVPVDLDIHAFDCPKGTPNRHLDIRFVAHAPAGAVAVCSEESLAVEWFDVDRLPVDLELGTLRLIARALAR